MQDDQTCLATIRKLVSKMGKNSKAGFDRIKPSLPLVNPSEIAGVFPENPTKPYDMLQIIKRIVDDPDVTLYKEDYGKSIICGYARIDGWAVGIVANQRLVVKNAAGEMQFGGVIYSESADKATRFIMNCNQKKIPLVFLHDVTGFMVGKRSEHGGIIKDGAKMVNAVANSTVPKFTVIIGNSFGAGNYAMCGKAMTQYFSAKYLGTGGVSLTFFGDGATPQGTFHESLNMATRWGLPAVYIIENNQYGMGTACARSNAVQDLAALKAPGYGMRSFTFDGLDLYASWKTAQEAIVLARTGQPVLVEAKTYRYRGHSVSDAGLYRSKEEVDRYKALDPIERVRGDRIACGWLDQAASDALDDEVAQEVRDAVAFAEESPEPPLSELARHVYAEA